MANVNFQTRIILKNDTTAQWLNNKNVILKKGEVGFEFLANGTVKMKVGDGFKTWEQLTYLSDAEVSAALATAQGYADTVGAGLQTQIDAIVAADTGKIAVAVKAEADARALSEKAITDRLNVIQGADTVDGSIARAVKAEADERVKADTALSDRLVAIEGTKDTEGSIARMVNAEAAARAEADNALDARLDTLEGSDAVEGSVAYAVKAEATLRAAADTIINEKLATIQGADTVDGSIAKALRDAKKYTDDVKKEILGEDVSETYDTLKEIQTWITGHGKEATDLAGALAQESTARAEADTAITARLDKLEGSDAVEGSVAYAVKAEADARAISEKAITDRLDALDGEGGLVDTAVSEAQDYTDEQVAVVQGALDTYKTATDATLATKANTSDLSTVAKSGLINDLVLAENTFLVLDGGSSTVGVEVKQEEVPNT